MQAQLKNPDARPLPLDWTEHFDTLSRQWYYINLDIVEPRATFVHPCDEPNDGLTSPVSQSSYFASRSCARSKQQEVLARPANPQDIAGPSRDPVTTVAQQLYATSLGSKVLRRPSVSGTRTSFTSDPDETASAGGSSSAFRRLPHGRRAKKNTGAASSPPLRPASVNSLIDFHDPKNFFDCTRLSGGPHRFFSEPQPPASSASPSPFAPQSIPSVPSPAPSSGNDRSSVVDLRPSLGKAVVSSDSTSIVHITEQISKEALALYHPIVFSKPVSPSSASAPMHGNRRSISLSLGSIQDFPVEQKPVQPPISTLDNGLSDTLRLYTAITEDEKLRVIPNSSPGSLLSIQADKRREHQFPPTINALDVQSSSSPSCVQIQTKLDRRDAVACVPADEQQPSLALAESLVLQQPRPVRPHIAVPARLSLQVETAEHARPF